MRMIAKSPISPLRINSLIVLWYQELRKYKLTAENKLEFSTHFTTSHSCSIVSATGFSEMTCLPNAIAFLICLLIRYDSGCRRLSPCQISCLWVRIADVKYLPLIALPHLLQIKSTHATKTYYTYFYFLIHILSFKDSHCFCQN